LSDDDLRTFNGNVDQLVGQIQRKTGEARQVIEEFLGEVAEETSGATAAIRDKVHDAASKVHDTASKVQEAATDTARQGYDALRQGYAEAERAVQERPAQSLAVAFGLGAVAGIGIALLLRGERPREATIASRSRAATEQLGRQIVDAISNLMPRG
jgi:ElaB/YqjD/DUF883 family membrane-anchored ribosome-binding protein